MLVSRRYGHLTPSRYDHTSILKLIEWRWGLRPLPLRDANANNLADELDFSTSNIEAPDFSVPQLIAGVPCTT